MNIFQCTITLSLFIIRFVYVSCLVFRTHHCMCCAYRSLVANLAAANDFDKAHLDKPEVWSSVEKAGFFYVSVSDIRWKQKHYVHTL